MRSELFYNPLLLFERVGEWATEERRLQKLRRTVASVLGKGHIDSLELLELLKPLQPKVIYDIGANVGTWTVLSKAVFPDAEVHAFEPLTFHLSGFAELTRELSNVRLYPLALGSSAGAAEMKVTDFSDASSFLPLAAAGRTQWNLRDAEKVSVRMERLDDWYMEAKIPKPDLLKLDVQGFELEVLKGSIECLASAKAVLTEVSFQEFYVNQCLFHEVVEFLSRYDFQLFALGHGTAVGRRLVQSDALFVKRELLSCVA